MRRCGKPLAKCQEDAHPLDVYGKTTPRDCQKGKNTARFDVLNDDLRLHEILVHPTVQLRIRELQVISWRLFQENFTTGIKRLKTEQVLRIKFRILHCLDWRVLTIWQRTPLLAFVWVHH